jgi:hypothetical protein
MAGQLSRMPVEFGVVFPCGAFVASVSAVRDFDASRPGQDVQARDKDTGELLWQVDVIPINAEGQAEQSVRVKIPASVQPVPPEALPGSPFRPVEFDGMTVTPWVDNQRCTGPRKGEPHRCRARIGYSLMAKGMRAPGAKPQQQNSAGKAA